MSAPAGSLNHAASADVKGTGWSDKAACVGPRGNEGKTQETTADRAEGDDPAVEDWEGEEGEGEEEEEDELASELWEGDVAGETDWMHAQLEGVVPGDEELCEDDDLDAEEEEDEEEDEEAAPLSTREAGAESPSDTRSSGSHRSAAETDEAAAADERTDGLAEGTGGAQAGAKAGDGVTPKKGAFKRAGSGGSRSSRRERAASDVRWGGEVDGEGDLVTTTIDFSQSVDLRKTPELLCKSKDRVPLFKLTASGSYNCTRNAFRRAGFRQTVGRMGVWIRATQDRGRDRRMHVCACLCATFVAAASCVAAVSFQTRSQQRRHV